MPASPAGCLARMAVCREELALVKAGRGDGTLLANYTRYIDASERLAAAVQELAEQEAVFVREMADALGFRCSS